MTVMGKAADIGFSGLFVRAQLVAEHTQPIPGLGELLVLFDCLLKTFRRRPDLFLGFLCTAQVVPSLGGFRVQFQGCLESLFGQIGPSQPEMDVSLIEMGVKIAFVHIQRFLIAGQRFFEPPGLVMGIAFVAPPVRPDFLRSIMLRSIMLRGDTGRHSVAAFDHCPRP